MSLPTPPRYVVIPEEVIEQAYAPDKPRRALLASFTRILSLAWEAKYLHTPPMDELELMEFLKVSRRQYYEQKSDMELMGWLRSSHPRPGFVQFTFRRSVADKISAQETSAENRTASAENPALIVGGESTDSNLHTDSIPPLKGNPGAENRTGMNAVEILRHTDKLFDGAIVRSKDLEDREPLQVLAWCAYVYSLKSKLTGPGGVVRNRLKDNEPAPEWAKERWRETLPCDFLEALGLIEYTCEICEAKFTKLADLEAHGATHPKLYACSACEQTFPSQEDLDVHEDQAHQVRPDESVSSPIREGSSLTAEQAWESVLTQLQMEMPRASFDSWVRDTKAVRYSRNALTIGVRNAYARDWLESRLASTVGRLLVGIMNDSSIAVEFVVAEEVS